MRINAIIDTWPTKEIFSDVMSKCYNRHLDYHVTQFLTEKARGSHRIGEGQMRGYPKDDKRNPGIKKNNQAGPIIKDTNG